MCQRSTGVHSPPAGQAARDLLADAERDLVTQCLVGCATYERLGSSWVEALSSTSSSGVAPGDVRRVEECVALCRVVADVLTRQVRFSVPVIRALLTACATASRSSIGVLESGDPVGSWCTAEVPRRCADHCDRLRVVL